MTNKSRLRVVTEKFVMERPLTLCLTSVSNPQPHTTLCQGRGNRSNEIPRLWQGAIEGTGGVFSQ